MTATSSQNEITVGGVSKMRRRRAINFVIAGHYISLASLTKVILIMLLLLLGVGLGIMAFFLIQNRTSSTMGKEFRLEYGKTVEALENTIAGSIFSAKIISVLITSTEKRNASFTRSDWDSFVTQLGLVKSGVHALHYTCYITAANRAAFEQANSQNYPEFHIKELLPNKTLAIASQRDAYQVVRYSSPYMGNEVAIGLDSYSTYSKTTFLAARSTGQVSVSPLFTLVQGNAFGVVVVVPAYRSLNPPATREMREATYLGAGVITFKINNLVASALYVPVPTTTTSSTVSAVATTATLPNASRSWWRWLEQFMLPVRSLSKAMFLTIPEDVPTSHMSIALFDMTAIAAAAATSATSTAGADKGTSSERNVLLYADKIPEFTGAEISPDFLRSRYGILLKSNISVGDRQWMVAAVPRDSFLDKFQVELHLPLVTLLAIIAATTTLCIYLLVSLRNAIIIRGLLKEKSALLDLMLPPEISKRVSKGEELIAESIPAACILFADIVGFTSLSSVMQPQALVKMLSTIFFHFDSLLEEYHVEKIKTIGDAYMACVGLFEGEATHDPAIKARNVRRIVEFAFAAMRIMQKITIEEADAQLQLRVGIHCGPVIAGVIGRKKPCFDIWSDAVNIASRLESTGLPGQIQVSQEIKDILQQDVEPLPLTALSPKTETFTPALKYLASTKRKLTVLSQDNQINRSKSIHIDIQPDIKFQQQQQQQHQANHHKIPYVFTSRQLDVKGKGKMTGYIITRGESEAESAARLLGVAPQFSIISPSLVHSPPLTAHNDNSNSSYVGSSSAAYSSESTYADYRTSNTNTNTTNNLLSQSYAPTTIQQALPILLNSGGDGFDDDCGCVNNNNHHHHHCCSTTTATTSTEECEFCSRTTCTTAGANCAPSPTMSVTTTASAESETNPFAPSTAVATC